MIKKKKKKRRARSATVICIYVLTHLTLLQRPTRSVGRDGSAKRLYGIRNANACLFATIVDDGQQRGKASFPWSCLSSRTVPCPHSAQRESSLAAVIGRAPWRACADRPPRSLRQLAIRTPPPHHAMAWWGPWRVAPDIAGIWGTLLLAAAPEGLGMSASRMQQQTRGYHEWCPRRYCLGSSMESPERHTRRQHSTHCATGRAVVAHTTRFCVAGETVTCESRRGAVVIESMASITPRSAHV